MVGWTRGPVTLLGVAAAGFLTWLSTQVSDGSNGRYWAAEGLLAAAGLTMAVSQLAGGWTKWGWPRVSQNVLFFAFLPALVAGGWVIVAGQPVSSWTQRHVLSWSHDIHIRGLVDDLRTMLPVLAFGLGLVFGLTFDTTGPLREPPPPPPELPPEPAPEAHPQESSEAPTEPAAESEPERWRIP